MKYAPNNENARGLNGDEISLFDILRFLKVA